MKKILQTAMVGFLVILISCGDGDSKTDDDTKTDTTAVADDMGTPTTSNVMTQTALPLGPDQEVPVNKSTASGTADVTYNKDTKMLTYTLNWSGLSGKPTMAHIHGTAPRGANAGVKHDLTNVLQKETSGNFTDSVKIGDDIKEDSLLSGMYYFNIHTPANPGGEIRGQIEFK